MASSFPKDNGTVEPHPNHNYLPLKVRVSPVNIYFYLLVRFFLESPRPLFCMFGIVSSARPSFSFLLVLSYFLLTNRVYNSKLYVVIVIY